MSERHIWSNKINAVRSHLNFSSNRKLKSMLKHIHIHIMCTLSLEYAAHNIFPRKIRKATLIKIIGLF